MRRIVVTGLGVITPVGNTADEAWSNIVAGRSGVRAIDTFDVSGFASRIGAAVRDFDLSSYMSPKEARKTDPFIHYGIAAAKQAIVHAGLEVTEKNRERIGIAIGSGIGGLPGIERGHESYLAGGPRRISPFFVPSNIINMIAGNLSIEYGIRGPNYGIVTACSTGTHNIGDAARMIERGDVDVMIAGGAEMATSPMGLGDSPPPARCRHATTIRKVRVAPGTRIGTDSCSATAPACWCSRHASTPPHAGLKFMPSSPGLE